MGVWQECLIRMQRLGSLFIFDCSANLVMSLVKKIIRIQSLRPSGSYAIFFHFNLLPTLIIIPIPDTRKLRLRLFD